MTTKCTSCVHFRMHIYAINTWLIILDSTIKPCIVGVYVEFEMNITCTFGRYGMDGIDTTTSFKFRMHFSLEVEVLGSFF